LFLIYPEIIDIRPINPPVQELGVVGVALVAILSYELQVNLLGLKKISIDVNCARELRVI
jgi:hypothetical protein